jgi:hypothetical protein
MPISTPRDENRVPTMLGTLNTDGTTVVSIKVVPTTHAVKISDGTTGTNHTTTNAQRDANRVPALWGVSSADGVTPVSIYTDVNGKLLVQST